MKKSWTILAVLALVGMFALTPTPANAGPWWRQGGWTSGYYYGPSVSYYSPGASYYYSTTSPYYGPYSTSYYYPPGYTSYYYSPGVSATYYSPSVSTYYNPYYYPMR